MPLFGPNEHEDKIRREAEEFRKKYSPSSSEPEEKGLEEEGFLDVVKPYKQAAIKGAGLGAGTALAADILVPDSPLFMADKASRAFKGASRLSRMAEEMPAAKKGLSALSKGERELALAKKGEEFESIAKNPEAFSEKVTASDKAARAQAQKMQDVQKKMRAAGGEISEGPALDYGPMKESEIAKIREKGTSPILDYKEINTVTAQPSKHPIDYSKFPKEEKIPPTGKTFKYKGRKVSIEDEE